MKRTFVVIIVVFETVLLLMFLVYAQVQRTNAVKQQQIAEAAKQEAEANVKMAMEQVAHADAAAKAAQASSEELLKKLEQCKRK